MGMQARWDRLVEIGYLFGYFVNELKTWVIVKHEELSYLKVLSLSSGAQACNILPAEDAILDCALDQYRIATNIAVKWLPGGVKNWRNYV